MGIIDRANKPFSLRDACLGINMNAMEQAVNANLRGYVAAARAADAKLYLDARKATGGVPGSNSPFTSPFVDLVGDNDATLTNFAATAADGYTTLPVLSRKGQEFTFANLLGADGNFGIDSNADGLADGWTTLNSVASKSVSGNEQVFTAGGQYGGIKHAVPYAAGDIIYAYAYVKSSGATRFQVGDIDGSPLGSANHSESGAYEFLSGQVTTVSGETENVVIVMDTRTSGYSEIRVKQAHGLNLTTIFPNPSFRPTKDQMDVIVQKAIATYGYINSRVLKIAWMQFLVADGVDSFGVIADNGSLDFTGTQDFAFSGVFVSPPTIQSGYLFMKGSNGSDRRSYGVLVNASANTLTVGIGPDQMSTPDRSLFANQIHTFAVIRKSGVLKMWINGVLLYSLSNVLYIADKNIIRILARGNAEDGSAQSVFFKGHLAMLTVHGANVTEASLQAFTDRAFADYLP